MNNGLGTLYFRNKHLLWLTIVIIIAGGISAWNILPRAEDPFVVNRLAFIVTPYPGATAENVEALVTEPIETQLKRMPETDWIKSFSLPGLSFVQVLLDDNVVKTDEAFSRIRDYINDAKLPADAGPPDFDDTRSYTFTKLLAIVVQNEDDWMLARRYARELASRLRIVEGTDKVSIYGSPDEEVLVSVDPQALSNLGLTITELAEKIRNSDSKVSSGVIENSKTKFSLEVAGGFELLQRLRELPIVSKEGAIISLNDIANVKLTHKTPIDNLANFNGKQAIVLAVRILKYKHINQWSDQVDKVIKEFEPDLPASITIKNIFDQTTYTNERFSSLQQNIAIGVSLIITILFITLGFRCAFIVGLALPLTILFTLMGLELFKLELQQMTVIGLVVALGIMIDNAIVIAESIQQMRLRGMQALMAVKQTIHHLWLPLLGATLTTILSFLPFALLPGALGEFVNGIGYSVIITLIGSYLISYTVIASLAGHYLNPIPHGKWYQTGIKAPKLAHFFTQLLIWCLKNVRKTTLVILIFSMTGFISLLGLTQQFFPASERNQINVSFFLSPVLSIEETQKISKQIREMIAQYPEVKHQAWFIGNSSPPYYYNLLIEQENNQTFAEGMITLNTNKNIKPLINRLQKKLNEAFPNALILVKEIVQGPPISAPLEIRIYGQDLNKLYSLGDTVRKRLREIPMITNTLSSLKPGLPKYLIDLNEQQVHALGLSTKKLAGLLNNAVDGVVAGDVLQGSELLPVRVRLNLKTREELSHLLELPISLVTGQNQYAATPLAAISKVQIKPGWLNISRRNSQRVNIILGYTPANVLPEEVINAWNKSIKATPLKLPPGYRIELGGENEERTHAYSRLFAKLPVITILLFTVLILSFRDMKLVFILFLTVIQAFSMGLLSLYLSGYPFGFQVLIGLVGLVGLAINAAIVILNEIVTNPKAKRGVIGELCKSVKTCIRHIVSTTLTTVVGFTPLIISGGLFWPPFAYAIAGGTLFTTLLSIFFVPVLYRMLTRGTKHPRKTKRTPVEVS